MSGVQPIPDFETLPDEVVREIAREGVVRRYPAGSIIINENDPGGSLFIVLSGRLKSFSYNASGKEVVYNTHGPGETLGEVSLDGGPRSASVMTLEPTACSIVMAEELGAFMARHPAFAEFLVRKLIRLVRRSTERVKSLALMDVYERIAQLLNSESEIEDGVRVVRERFTHQDIADRVGCSREMVSKILKELVKGGYISVNGKRILLNRKLPDAW